MLSAAANADQPAEKPPETAADKMKNNTKKLKGLLGF
jgi:hypothetical protein